MTTQPQPADYAAAREIYNRIADMPANLLLSGQEMAVIIASHRPGDTTMTTQPQSVDWTRAAANEIIELAHDTEQDFAAYPDVVAGIILRHAQADALAAARGAMRQALFAIAEDENGPDILMTPAEFKATEMLRAALSALAPDSEQEAAHRDNYGAEQV